MDQDRGMEQEIGDFLRSRRARIRPEDAGLPQYGRRRVPGLRREELAQLAGVSVDYYVRLEQGRTPNVSDAILDAIGRALRLDGTERGHLSALVRRTAGTPEALEQTVRPGARRLLDMMDATPAFVLGRRMDVLAWNALAGAIGGFGPGFNVVRHTFCDPAARAFYADWPAVAAEAVAYLRLDAGRHPGDPRLAALVAEISAASPDFAALWAEHPVREKTHGDKLIEHPDLGRLDLRYETLRWPGEDNQLLVVYTAGEGSDTLARLQRIPR
jgi:transcriptional regulator with XRE-family HTH domain